MIELERAGHAKAVVQSELRMVRRVGPGKRCFSAWVAAQLRGVRATGGQ